MNIFVFFIQFFFLNVEINSLTIKSCIHNDNIYTSLQNNPIKVGCEADQELWGCTLRKSDSANKYCQYLYFGQTWIWYRSDCPPETITSKWISYEKCEFIISNPSVTG